MHTDCLAKMTGWFTNKAMVTTTTAANNLNNRVNNSYLAYFQAIRRLKVK